VLEDANDPGYSMARLSRILKSASWKYAFGELLLIVVGVTIALAATSWYEDQQLRRDELSVLQEIHTTLNEDLDAIEADYNTILEANRDIAILIRDLESGEPWSAEVFHGIGSLMRFVVVNIKSGPFETLKARGLDLISNESLRAKLTSLYEDEFPILGKNAEIDRFLSRDTILPYIFEHFQLDASGDWVPKEYEAADVISLGRYRSRTFTQHYLPSFEITMASMRDILTEIDKELPEGDKR
jgi:hypothetical protein